MSLEDEVGSDETVFLRGQRIRVRRHGEGKPLLLINGIGGAVEMWDPLTQNMPNRHIIKFDLPGTGESPAPIIPVTMAWNARIVNQLLDELGYDRVDVLGYSFGGAVAQEFAWRYPERVDRLLLCGTMPGAPSVLPDPTVLLMMMTPLRYMSRRLGEFMVPRIAGGRTARDPEALEAGLDKRQQRPPTFWGYTTQLMAVSMFSSHLHLPTIEARTLVLHGDDDRVVPVENARYAADKLQHAQLSILEGAGHMFLLDEPHRSAEVIEDFLDGVPAEAPQRRSERGELIADEG